MIDFLAAPLDHASLVALFREQRPVSPLPPLGDARWARVFASPALASARGALLAAAAAERTEPLPELTNALYADYAATGIRLNFENPYFERRSHLARAALALLERGSVPALELATSLEARSFLEKFEAIFDEVSWALPAHVPGPTGRESGMVDLFAARTANALAEYLHVFAAIIPAALRERVRARLRRDVFESFLARDFFWMESTNNWNAVCHQGVLGAALAVEDDADLLARLCLRAREALPRFLAGFGPDGACSEGPAYWDFGFGWFAYLNTQLETRTGGRLSLFASRDIFPLMAGYAPALALAGGGVVNFSDCAPTATLRPHILHDLGERLALPACAELASVQLRAHLDEAGSVLVARRTDFLYWPRLLLAAPEILARVGSDGGAVTAALAPDVYYPSFGLWVARGRDRAGHLWEIAAKAGHNDEHHNHDDVGSFILHVDGRPFIAEIGRPAYTREFFSPGTRYSFLAARTLGHSLPIINGREQGTGARFAGVVSLAETGGERVAFEAELAGAYPDEAACTSFRRRLDFDKNAGVCVWRDSIRLRSPGEVESAVITVGGDEGCVVIESPEVLLIRRDGLTLELRVGGGGVVWRRVETHDYTAHDGAPARCRRAVMTAAGEAAEWVSRVEIRLRTGSGN